jgi:arginine/lysine/ornithine decarboxylase
MNDSSPSLKKRIDSYLERKPLHFHSPAHSGSLHPRDLSELTSLDSLDYPQEILMDIESFIAELFGARSSHLLVNGASLGNQAACIAVKKYLSSQSIEKPVLISPNCHKSSIAGLILADLDFDFLEDNFNSLESSKDLSEKYSALFLTNPSYEGIYKKIPRLNIPVIVDEAHGGHYYFTDLLPEGALNSGADLIVQSWHKTLGSLTQTGVLHVSKKSLISQDLVKSSINLLQTSSPSYLLMESLSETALWLYKSGKNIFDKHIARCIDLGLKYFDDPSRAILQFYSSDHKLIPGPIIEEILETEYEIAVEAAFFEYALAFINHKLEDTALQSLKKAANELKKTFSSKKLENIFQELKLDYSSFSEINLSPNLKRKQHSNSRNSYFRDLETLYAPCPPGFPLLIPGFELTEDIISAIKWRKIFYPESINL